MSEAPQRILIVEDQRLMAAELAEMVRHLGYVVAGTVALGEEAIRVAGTVRPELVLMDIQLEGDMDGIQAAAIIRELFDVPVVYLTAHADEGTILRAKETAPLGYVVKPCNERELKAAIEVALYRQQTERLLAEERARRKYAEEAERQKDSYIAMLGHELRNPLAAIRSATELLKATSSAGEPDHTWLVLERQSAHMTRIIDGLLDVARMAGGKLAMEYDAIDVTGVLREMVEDTPRGRSGVAIDLRLPDTPLWVRADRVRLLQVFDNLLSNALRFTEQGWIRVQAVRERQQVVVRVQDTGIGIEPELLPHVFEPFRQGCQTLARAAGGLGLGLALVKGIVELMGGTVQVHSAGVGRGSEFVVRLPRGAAPAVKELPEPLIHVDFCRILIVEDNVDAAETLQAVLQSSGHHVEVAFDGSSALALAARFTPEMVLCDIGLPGGMSGYDVARALRRTCRALLVAVSGYGAPDDLRRSQEAGFHAHLVKPVDSAAIERLWAARRQAGDVKVQPSVMTQNVH